MNLALGATFLEGIGCQFNLWGPLVEEVEVQILDAAGSVSAAHATPTSPQQGRSRVRLKRSDNGYHRGIIDGVQPGARYLYCLDGKMDRPDPASKFQPEGVHCPSEIIDPKCLNGEDKDWKGLSLEDYIIYEVHVGTYTAQGTFEAIIPRLDELKTLGVTAIELMPVAQFPGNRNWGYDGVYPFAVQNGYGGPSGMRKLVEACHQRELAVVLDVVYNHLGPEGNYLADFAPYFTDQYRTPWGRAINFDGPESDEVVRFFIENALYWLRDFHIDALRLDAIHGIVDSNAQPFLQLLAKEVREFARQSGRKIHLIAESDLNDTRVIRPAESGGYGLDAQWSDDFHHALHTLLTGERTGYYEDFGKLEHLRKALEEGFVYSGQYSNHRRRRHGNSSREVPAQQFVVSAQNHDQVGNRLFGDRLSTLLSFEALKLAAGMVLLSPFIPLLFMGEEWGERAPFLYFNSHSDAALIEAVRRGRREEFAAFRWEGEPLDPQDEATYLNSKVDHTLKQRDPHEKLWRYYQELIKLRKSVAALAHLSKVQMAVHAYEKENVLQIHRWHKREHAMIFANFSDDISAVTWATQNGEWHKTLDSTDSRWAGPGNTVASTLDSIQQNNLSLAPKSLLIFQMSE